MRSRVKVRGKKTDETGNRRMIDNPGKWSQTGGGPNIFSEVLDSIQDGISILNNDLTIRLVNKTMERRHTGNMPLVGKTCFQAYHNRTEPCETCPTLRCLESGKDETNIVERHLDSGTEWIELFSYPLRDPATGGVTGVVEYVRDITGRMRAEAGLRESEKRYRLLFEGANDAIFIMSGECFLECNEMTLRMFGCQRKEDIVGHHPWEFSPPRQPDGRDSREAAMEVIQAALEGKPQRFYWKHIQKDGTLFDAEVSLTRFNLENNVFLHAMVRNITERSQAERLQRAVYEISQATEQAASLDDLFKSVHRIIGTVMPAENFYISLFDHAKNRISFPYFMDVVDVHPTHTTPRKGLTEYVLGTGKSLLCDEAKDRDLRARGDVELIGAPSAIWLGVPLIVERKTIGVMVVQHYTDPTAYGNRERQMLEYVSSQVAKAIEHKRAEEKLNEQAALINQAQDAISVRDLDNRILFWNNGAETLYGWKQEEVLGKNAHDILCRQEFAEQHQEAFRDTLVRGEWKGELRQVSKDMKDVVVESHGTLLRDERGNPRSILIITRNITERKNLEKQFLRAQRMESIGTLAGGIAHDLNNVLAPIMMAIEILKKKHQEAESQRMLTTLETSAKRGSDIVKQILAFGRGVEGERILLQPKHIVGEIVKIIAETFPKSIVTKTDFSKNLHTVLGDPTQLHQVLLNICVNARDAMPHGGVLTLSTENVLLDEYYTRTDLEAKPGEYVVVTVTDTGTGIASDVLEKIFDPFFTTKEIGKGTGLGLSTALAIVKSHGGFIHVYSEPAKGSTFKIYLPAHLKDQKDFKEEEHHELPSGNGELVLVVDDEASVREIAKVTLESNGYRVLTANDGVEAISIYAQDDGQIKVVLTDIMMPAMDGAATIRALQMMKASAKIIAMSGLSARENEVMSSVRGAQAFLLKPYTAEKLLTTLQQVLKS